MLEYMIIGHYYFHSKWYSSAHAMTHLHSGTASGLKGMTHPYWLELGESVFKIARFWIVLSEAKP